MKTSLWWIASLGLVLACPADPGEDGGASASGSSGGSSGSSAETSATEASASGESESGESSESGSASGSETGSPEIDLDCVDPRPLMQLDDVTPSGFVACDDDFVHRVEAVTCLLPDASMTCDGEGGCNSADCTAAPFGACITEGDQCNCVYGCETDADCGAGEVCACTGAFSNSPRCVPANCTTSADCGEGLCGLTGTNECQSQYFVACLDATAECRRTTCNDDTECVCYADGLEYTCHDDCFTGCG